MPIIRLILLLGLAGGLFLLVQFNWSPLPLTFLGLQTPALPLALWILSAIAAGIVTNLLITSLFSLSNYFAVRAARSRSRQTPRQSGFQTRSTPSESTSYARASTAKTTNDDADWNDWEGYEESRQASARSPVDEDPIDDWETETSDDWDVDAPRDTPVARTGSSVRTNYEAKQEPKANSRSVLCTLTAIAIPKIRVSAKLNQCLTNPLSMLIIVSLCRRFDRWMNLLALNPLQPKVQMTGLKTVMSLRIAVLDAIASKASNG